MAWTAAGFPVDSRDNFFAGLVVPRSVQKPFSWSKAQKSIFLGLWRILSPGPKTNAFDHPAPTPASGTLTAFISSCPAGLERCLDQGDDNAGFLRRRSFIQEGFQRGEQGGGSSSKRDPIWKVHSGNACSNIRVIFFTAAVTRCASGEHLLAFTLERFVQKLPTSRLSLSAVASYSFFLPGSHSVMPFFHAVTP